MSRYEWAILMSETYAKQNDCDESEYYYNMAQYFKRMEKYFKKENDK